jgi:hypothetical protein
MSVQEIEAAITKLPASELAELVAWLGDYRHQVWEQQIERDLDAGRLDKLLAEVQKECDAGLARPL